MGKAVTLLNKPNNVQNFYPADDLSGLFPVENDGSMILFIPQNAGFLHGGNEADGLPVVSDVQLYHDLRQMPGRN